MDKVNPRTTQLGGLGQEDTHGTTAAVGEGAGGIKGLDRWPSGHQQPTTQPVTSGMGGWCTTTEQTRGREFDQLGGGHPPVTLPVTGQQAWRGIQGHHAREALDPLPVVLDCRVAPHGRVHGGSSQNRAFAGQEHTGQKPIG